MVRSTLISGLALLLVACGASARGSGSGADAAAQALAEAEAARQNRLSDDDGPAPTQAEIRLAAANTGMRDAQMYTDPKGFAILRPSGWMVSSPGLAEIWVVEPGYRSFALVRGRRVRGDLAAWMQRGLMSSEPWVRQVTAQVVQPERTSVQGTRAARATYRIVDAQGARKRVQVVAVQFGEFATTFIAAAPDDRAQFEGALPRLAAILDSLRFAPARRGGGGGGGGGNALATLRWMPWMDPVERSFTTEIPQGWGVQGGMTRNGSKPLVAYQVLSPDRAINVFVGHPGLVTYVVPNQTIASLGGSPGVPIRPFTSAAQMGAEIANQRYGAVQVTGVRPRPDLAQQIRSGPAMGGSVNVADAADLELRLADGRVGAMTVSVSGNDVPGIAASWFVNHVYGFIAPPQQAGLAGGVLARMIGASRTNPQWFMVETRMNQIDTQRYLQYLEQSQAQQAQMVNARWNQQVQQVGAMNDLLGNTVQLVDPQTGERAQVTASSRYYYGANDPHIPRDAVVGTDVQVNPDPIQLRQMLQVGTDLPYT